MVEYSFTLEVEEPQEELVYFLTFITYQEEVEYPFQVVLVELNLEVKVSIHFIISLPFLEEEEYQVEEPREC